VTADQLNPREFEQFRGFIYQRSGIKIGDRKVSLLSNRIRRRLKARGFADFKTYYRYLSSPQAADELEYFLDAITTNETSFFRTPAHFQWLKSSFLPEVVAAQRRGERKPSLRFWSAACASGAEPYSIAICLAENKFRMPDWSITILGTDISQYELAKARHAAFKSRAVESLSQQQLRRFFQPVESDVWQVRPAIREVVEFSQHNLMQPIKRQPFDCIFLCNVLIYFDQDSKQAVVDNLTNALAIGGYLVIGPSEGVFDVLGAMKRHSACVYQKV
jgi:chemotaxis protein methyltransferase CheR